MNLKDEILKDRILSRIDELLNKNPDRGWDTFGSEVAFAVANMLELVYGRESLQIDQVETLRKQVYDGKWVEHIKPQIFVQGLRGLLLELQAAIKDGRIVNIQSEARGEVLGDFLVLAREALNEGQKNVAAVLACAALEDALKRCATDQGLEVYDQDMSDVVNALKSKGVIRGPRGEVLRGYVQIRNKAFHAQWDAIDAADVNGIIAFTEIFLVERFSSSSAEE